MCLRSAVSSHLYQHPSFSDARVIAGVCHFVCLSLFALSVQRSHGGEVTGVTVRLRLD